MNDGSFEKDYLNILKDLKSSKTTVVYKGLCLLNSSNIDINAFELLKEIAENSSTFKNKKIAFDLIIRNFPDKLHLIDFRLNNNLGYIYFIREKLYGHIKIGRSKNLEKRLQVFANNLPFEIELLNFIKSHNYEKIELEFHKHFIEKRIQGEWFKLDSSDIKKIISSDFPEEIKKMIKTSL